MRALFAASLAAVLFGAQLPPITQPETRRSIGGLPAHIAAAFEQIAACHLSSSGDFLVFDRRAHAVFSVPAGADSPKKIVDIGEETGRILRPSAFDSAPGGTFLVADAPGDRRRIQFFSEAGSSQGGFTLAGRGVQGITVGDLVIAGVGSIEFTGSSLLIAQPEIGALVTEYGLTGETIRTFGDLRSTGQEKDREVHLALNTVLALVNPKGGYFFVFVSGVPMFRKYDAAGRLVFERHIEGPAIDEHIRQLPTTWVPRRRAAGEHPIVPASIRAAAVDHDGNLWVSLIAPYTYVYDGTGEKARTIQFRAAGVVAPSGFFFTKDRRVLVSPGCYAFASAL